jgi:hypothetical protein
MAREHKKRQEKPKQKGKQTQRKDISLMPSLSSRFAPWTAMTVASAQCNGSYRDKFTNSHIDTNRVLVKIKNSNNNNNNNNGVFDCDCTVSLPSNITTQF